MKLKYAELHTPLFMGGINYGTKLSSNMRSTEAELTYIHEEGLLVIKHNDNEGLIPISNVAVMLKNNPNEKVAPKAFGKAKV